MKTGVTGASIMPCVPGERQFLEELLYEVTQQMPGDAGLMINGIDGIVVGGTTSTTAASSG